MIQLNFDEQVEKDIRLICTRKGFTLESYIIDNFEWDSPLPCMDEDIKKITELVCEGCDYIDRCPDAEKGASP